MMNPVNAIKKYVRLANYIGAAQIYLKDNFLLQDPLKSEHIKPRLLGHWGTVPGQNFIYANLNYFIKRYGLDMIYVSGPGHGFPAVQANLWIEGTLSEFYDDIPRNETGLARMITKFSWPYGFPSHANPGAPGTIVEGGELGYSLSTSFGAVMDNPDLTVACCVGDGESETGPLAAAWNSIKFINPKRDGIVLPFLHLNGYKISGPTVFGVMSDREISDYFKGLGYRPYFVEYSGNDAAVYSRMFRTLHDVFKHIEYIKSHFGGKTGRPDYPVVILRTPKGWTGIKKIRSIEMEGTWRAHQVVAPDCMEDPYQLKQVENWLRSYKVDELLNDNGEPLPELLSIVPSLGMRMGENSHTMCDARLNDKPVSGLRSRVRKELFLPKLSDNEIKFKIKGTDENNSMKVAGNYVKAIYKLNEANTNFRLFCPDETTSNRLTAVFDATDRMMMWPFDTHNNPHTSHHGRVMEMLSEHTLQGWIQGYILTGRHGIFSSYEAFIQIVASMVEQYVKFLKQSSLHKFREPVSSLNYILTSLGWRQDHNGFSHQSPSFVSGMLETFGEYVSVYLPVDSNMMLATLELCMKSTNKVNVIVAGKTPERQWLTLADARKQMTKNMMIWDFMSDKNPDIVFASSGDYITEEVIAAMGILRDELPGIRLRFIYVSELSALGLGNDEDEVNAEEFKEIFTRDKKVIFSFHGYPATIKKLIFGHDIDKNFVINGYNEEGSTTTPFDMLVRNGVSRFQLANQACYELIQNQPGKWKTKCMKFMKKSSTILDVHKKYIMRYGEDPVFIKSGWSKSKDYGMQYKLSGDQNLHKFLNLVK